MVVLEQRTPSGIDDHLVGGDAQANRCVERVLLIILDFREPPFEVCNSS